VPFAEAAAAGRIAAGGAARRFGFFVVELPRAIVPPG
jgi:hypothetical protein